MAKETKENSGMKKLATFIVDNRNLIFLLYAVALVFSVFSMGWVQVENDITSYLPEDTETRQGLTVMNENFTSFGTAQVMVSNITYPKAQALAEEIGKIEGVGQVSFGESEEYYRDAAALFGVSFTGTESDPVSIAAMDGIYALLQDYDSYVDTTVGYDMSAELAEEMLEIVIVASVIIVVVLVLTSNAYMEVPVLILNFGAAALLNMGTNFLCGKISFISNSIAVVLQLALAIDYAIILCHRFSDEHKLLPAREACIEALSKAIPEIASSSLTTISGLGALGFMHFGIGLDMAIVLVKAIFLSLMTVFTLMPGLLMLFSKLIDRTEHRILIPKITAIGKFDMKTRFIVPPLFLLVVVGAFFFSSRCPYAYSYNEVATAKQNQRQVAIQKIKEKFGSSNMMAILVPAGDYESEGAILRRLSREPDVKTAMGLANIEAMDGYLLTDALTPRQFSELAGLDYEVAKLLYTAYAANDSQYGEIISGVGSYQVPLFDMFMFLKDQMQAGNIRLEGETQQMLDEMFDQLEMARLQLRSDRYSRLVVVLSLPEEGERTFALTDEIHDIVREYYGSDFYILGGTTSSMDLSASFGEDNLLISILSALFVMLILLFTFRSAGLPVLLILVIQGSIWMNFSVPAILNTPLYFLGYLIVNAIQMGANIDYAIVISSHYGGLKHRYEPKQAMIAALNEAFPTVFTSGTIMASAANLIALLTSNPVIATMGACLGRGTIISIVLVLCVLPQLLVVGDRIVEATSFRLGGKARQTRTGEGTLRLHGHVRGQLSGMVDAEIHGVVKGSFTGTVNAGGMPEQQEEGGEGL